jgi:hypothetical protein
MVNDGDGSNLQAYRLTGLQAYRLTGLQAAGLIT